MQAPSALAWLPAFAGLLATAAVAWWIRPTRGQFHLAGLLFLCVRYVLTSVLAGLGALFGSAILIGRRTVMEPRMVAAMVWVPPLVLFFAHRSLWAGVAAVAIVWEFTNKLPRPSPENRSATHSFVPSFAAACAAVLAQSAGTAILLGWPLASIPLVATAAAFAAWSWNRYAVTSRVTRYRAGLPVALAVAFTLLGLIPYLRLPGAGRGEDASDSGYRAATDPLSGQYKGVILLPDIAPHPLTLPPLPYLRHDLLTLRQDNPTTVPFFGVYWMYRFPQSQPPPGSYVVKGTPLTKSFRSSDRFPLAMEARQNFGKLIDMSCCSAIRVAVSSRDPNAETIALELILNNTTLPAFSRRGSQTLGALLVGPALERTGGDLEASEHAVLEFPMPANPMIREFDEVTVVFRRAVRFESARVSIDSFVFVPKGLL